MTSFTDQHRERFLALLCRYLDYGVAAAHPLWQELETAYREPHRSYHTAQHIIECLEHLDQCVSLYRSDPGLYKKGAQYHLQAIELAIWWHDIVYQTAQNSTIGNEQLSASYAYFTARETKSYIYVANLILATDHKKEPGSVDVANGDVIADIDLAILGAEPERFEQYEQQISEEYRHVPPQQYNEARRKFIQGMLDRPRIYHTDYFHDRFEARARENLARLVNRTP